VTDLPRENVPPCPRPPALDPVPRRITNRRGGALVAKTKRALPVPETHHAPTCYLPPGDILATPRPTEGNGFCEWKALRAISTRWLGRQP